MRGLLTPLFVVVIAALAVFVSLEAAQTDAVTVTVTVQNLSVAVTDGGVAYGTMTTSAQEDTTSSGVNDSQTATNDGNITEDFNILGQNTGAWTLAATAGSEQYVHEFCNNGNCDSSPAWTAITTSYQQVANSIATSGTQEFDLRIGTPTSTSTFTQQSADVTVQAVAD